MKALSLWQPWASLVALGVKRIETRSWQTSYRGPLAIHAAKRRCRAEAYDEPLYRPGDLGNPATLPLGAVVAKAICRACPVKAECLAKFGQEPFGVIAGLTELERRRLNNRNERSYRVLTGPHIRERAGRY